ncbi:MAG: HAD family phosphatase [Chlamydiales bacterium]|nr:HAD family phosphatase [Chlamydiales bacterium]
MIAIVHWIHDYQLFLFDFDGILVNTEELHYLAYKKMCANRGFSLKWDMRTYIRHAMYSASGLKEGIYQEFPDLKRYEPCWEILYREKKQAYAELLVRRGASLMPGVERLLKELERSGIKRCVVTHSSAEQIKLIRARQPVLNSIPHWITREDYSEPKPSPECYQRAIEKLAEEGERVIGFEDSPRGLKALLGTDAKAVLVTDLFSEQELKKLAQELDKKFEHVSSFDDLGK